MRKRLPLILICLLFLATRLFKIAEIPPSVYWDEASIGYNAYSIVSTAKDEWGETLPLHFRAFGEFKLPVYIYSVAPFIKFYSLSALAVRLPAVIYSSGTLILIYLLTKRITKSEISSVFSAFFFAVSPWGAIITRAGYEVTAGVFFFLLAFYLFFLSFKKPGYFLVSSLSHILAIYSYNSLRIISPIFLAVTTIIFLWKFRDGIKKPLIYAFISLSFVLISFIPIYRLYKFDTGGLRYQAVSLQGTSKEKISQFTSNYLSYFSPSFLFISGDSNPRSQVPGWGELYWVSLPLIVLGAVELFRKRSIIHYPVLIALLLSPIPASLTRENPHALRTFLMFCLWAVVFGMGVNFFEQIKWKQKRIIIYLLVIFMFFSFEALGQDIYLNYNRKTAHDWQIEYKKILTAYEEMFTKTDGCNRKKMVITDEYGQPYIFALFYLKIDPEVFRQTVKYNPPERWGFSTVKSFANFEFKHEE